MFKKKNLIGLVIVVVIIGCISWRYQYIQAKKNIERAEASKKLLDTFSQASLEVKKAKERQAKQGENREKRIKDGTAIVERIVNYYPNGHKSEEYTLVDGKKEGPYFSWYESGNKRHEWNYKNGWAYGLQISFYDNETNSKKSEETYAPNAIDNHYSWYDDGSLECHKFFSEKRIDRENWRICLYKDGKKESEVRYNEKTKMVDFIQWYKSGQMKSIYSKGYSSEKKAIVSIVKTWHENGQLKSSRTSMNNELDGLLQEWDENGVLIINEHWVNGYLDGKNTDPKYIRKEYRNNYRYYLK